LVETGVVLCGSLKALRAGNRAPSQALASLRSREHVST
jgi:hypothetical protein